MKLGLAVVLLLLALWQAEAATFPASITSGFSGCAGAASPVYQPTTQSSCSFSATSSLSSVRWGVPAISGGSRSGLQFEPPAGSITLNTDSDTYVGKLTHFNFPLSDATYDSNPSLTEIPSVVQLRLSVRVTLPSGAQTFNPQFPLQVQETKNDATPLSNGVCTQAVNNPDWNLPAQGITGWNNGLPCCPYGSTIRCSDKITFSNLLDLTTEFDDGISRYTLLLQGFKDTQSPSGTAVNKFISQEQQNSVAYLYARLTVKCTGAASCAINPNDQAKQCRVGSCNTVSGVCVYNPNTALNGQNCPIGINTPHPQCQKPVCSSGECILSTIAGSDGQSCSTSTGGRPADSCTVEKCNAGICVLQNSLTSPNCTDQSAGVTQYAPCTEQRCLTGKCTLRGIDNRACVPPGTTFDSRCSRGTCKKKTISGGIEVGTCSLKRITSPNGADFSSCTAPAGGQACKWVQCEVTTNYPKGSCTYSYISAATNCGATPGECQTRTCDGSGNCVLANKPTTVSCTGIPAATCKDRKCDGAGNCQHVPQSSSTTCSSLPTVACKNQRCDGAGTCEYVNVAATTTCSANPTVACKNQQCDGQGTCEYVNQASGVTCSANPSVACKNQQCDGQGTCEYVNQASGTSCNSIPGMACRSRKCDGQGTCEYVNEPNKVACTNLTAPSSSTCMKRFCKPGAGTCTYSVAAGVTGTCSSISESSCRNRGCKGTSTSLTAGPWSKCALMSNEPDGGSCSATPPFPSHVCYRRICQSGKCTKVANPSPSGSCTSTPTLGTVSSTPTTVNAVECKRRTCDTTTAVCTPLSDNSKDGAACTGPNAGDCTASQCLAGACGIRNVSVGSCANLVSISPVPNSCIRRLCGQAGKPAGQCGLVISTGGSCSAHWATQFNNGNGLSVNRSCIDLLCAANGTCIIQLKTNGASCGSAPCLDYTCQNGVCTVANKPNGPQSGCTGGTTNACKRPECVNGVCTLGVTHNVGGSCSTMLSSDLCNNRLCDATGTCRYFYKNNPTQGCSNDGANSGCTVKKCGNMTSGTVGKGTCVDLSNTVVGLACGSEIPGACFSRQCVSGQCVKRADASKTNKQCEIAVHCSSKREEDENYGLSHTLVSRDLLPPLNGSSDCQPKAAEDAGCYAYQCSNGGQCKSVAVNNNAGCGPTPPNAIQPGTTFACKQYVCSAGSCNTSPSATVDILEGEFCSGFQPCDPTTDGCNDECQSYVCHSGTCELDLREGETCDYPKRPTYRRGERDEILVPTECQEARCRGGRCALWTIVDGTGCGDRQNNSCANDTCISGQCVASETNCSHIQSPSVCFDVTCDPENGECGLKLNGVVDCTCISDCASCTKVNRLVNESAEAQETDSVLQNGACWWCPDADKPGCYNRINFETGEVVYYEDPVTGERTEKPDPSCVSSEDDCGGSSDLTGGEIAGIVVAAVAVAAIAAVALGAAALLARFLQASSTAGEDAILTDVAFESNAADNPFHQSKWTQSDLVGSIAADAVPSAHFVTN